MLCDHVCDEIRLTNRFSTENAFKIFKSKDVYKNKIFDRPINMSLVNIFLTWIGRALVFFMKI